jgi:predicted ATPase/class 3 adenylate cyclase
MSSRGLPSGTVTFLFTDVEGSTRLLGELGEGTYAEALAEHRRVIRAACAAHGGAEVDTQGDAFFFAFPTAPGALEAAAALTAGLDNGPVLVRVGLHTGTPLLGDEGYVGHDVHRAARIAAAGHGGQVLVSASTAQLLEADLRDLGRHRFKDLGAPERVYQLGDGDFPPLKSLDRTNLPIPATPFLGRERELGEITELLARDGTRLLTLTGVGGTGKTRLAIQAAAEASDAYPDGVWWIPLADFRDPSLVLEAAAQTVGSTSGLAEDLADKRLLLLFDNFEHIVVAAKDVAVLLASCPNLAVLATSREPLHVTGEQTYPVPPLDRGEGVAYFVARARAVDPAFEPDESLAEICRRLDDHPLALELAAARVSVLSTSSMLERLDERLPLLTGGARDLPERQRTLRGTIEWSYDLLEPPEQRVFRALSVFAGGCSLEAAEHVCAADLDTIQSLVDKSLLRRNGDRYWMLATLREYATELLRDAREATDVGRRHAEHVCALAASWNLTNNPTSEQRFDLARTNVDNVRAALTWALAHDEIELGVELAAALDYFWFSNHPSEGLRWFSSLLETAEDVPLRLRVPALRAYGNCAFLLGNESSATSLWGEALVLARELDDERAEVGLLLELANASLGAALRDDDFDDVERLLSEALDARSGASWPENELFSLQIRADVARFRDSDLDMARELLRRSAAVAREAHHTWWEAVESAGLSAVEYAAGQIELAERHALTALELQYRIGDRGAIGSLGRLARLARDRGDANRAGWLWGAMEAEEARRPVSWAFDRGVWERQIVADGEPDFERARREGSLLTLDEAVERALGLPVAEV